MRQICECLGYMLDHPTLKGWKRCITCGKCIDADGYNKLNRKNIEKTKKECSCEDYESGGPCQFCKKCSDKED